MKGKAILFGLNYKHCKSGQLNGCINDVNMFSKYLNEEYELDVEKYTDDVNRMETSKLGIITKLYDLALETHSKNLDFVWIHYSGHGSYVNDTRRNGDENDRRDECLVPSDYETSGMLVDDQIQQILSFINPKTKVFCIFDCCHSGTIADLKYSWRNPKKPLIENIKSRIKTKIISISGCKDNQTSSDAYNILDDDKYAGALSAFLLICLKENKSITNDVFALVDKLRKKLKSNGYSQYPILCSSFNLTKNKSIF